MSYTKSLFFLSCVCGMVFASCSERDGEPAVHERDSVVLSVGIASPGTRTWLDSSSDASVLPVYWSDGDCISVNGMQSSPLKVEAGEKLSQAQFELLNVEAPYSVLYPASAFSSAAADGTLRIQLPSSQEWVEGSFAPGAAVLCGRGESDAAPVSLYNLCGAVRVRLSDTEGAIITGLRLESIGDAQICGAYDLDMDNRELVPAGFRAQAAGDAQAALEYMLMAAEYPENQFYGHLEYYARDAQVYYNIGLAYENAGDAENARRYYGMAAEVEVKPKDAVYNYEKGLALRKLDSKAPVRDLYKGIVEAGKGAVTDQVQNFFESFDRGPYEDDVNTAAYYVQGIGYKALGREGKARRLFKKALAERNDNLWANYYLGNLK